jgi:hypothetical protein
MDWEKTKEEIEKTIDNKPTLIDSTGVGDPIVEAMQRIRPNIEGFKFSSASKQQIMEGLAAGIHQGRTSVLNGIHREELESYEFEYTRTGVKYTCPSGLHDDTVCAHALAFYKLTNRQTGSFRISVI